MSVTPTGAPAWVRTVAFSDYGGHTQKRDYGGQGAINPYTDVSAAQFSRMVSDVAAAVRTAPFAIITFLCNDTSPAAPTIESVYMMTAVRTASYEGDAAPTGFPSAARNGDGDVTFTFDATYDDEYGVEGTLALLAATAGVQGTSGHRSAGAELLSTTTVQVTVFDDTGAAVEDARVTLLVY